MRNPTPYRTLPVERRVALVTHVMKASKEGRALFIQRLTARGGFRAVTLQAWPVDKVAREVVRTNAETAQDEFDLLHALFVEVEPQYQATFLDAAGVAHQDGRMDEELEPPFAAADAVRRGADAVRAAHGEEGERYLRTLARYAPDGWPGITDVVAELDAAKQG